MSRDARAARAGMPSWDGPLGPLRRTALGFRIALDAVMVRASVRRVPLPVLVERLGRPGRGRLRIEPRRLGRIVYRVMNAGPFRPRCLTMALVHLRMLHRQGTPADLVVGLPAAAVDHQAHAWVEIDGRDVGPPPGKGTHRELARYGPSRRKRRPDTPP